MDDFFVGGGAGFDDAAGEEVGIDVGKGVRGGGEEAGDGAFAGGDGAGEAEEEHLVYGGSGRGKGGLRRAMGLR